MVAFHALEKKGLLSFVVLDGRRELLRRPIGEVTLCITSFPSCIIPNVKHRNGKPASESRCHCFAVCIERVWGSRSASQHMLEAVDVIRKAGMTDRAHQPCFEG